MKPTLLNKTLDMYLISFRAANHTLNELKGTFNWLRNTLNLLLMPLCDLHEQETISEETIYLNSHQLESDLSGFNHCENENNFLCRALKNRGKMMIGVYFASLCPQDSARINKKM